MYKNKNSPEVKITYAKINVTYVSVVSQMNSKFRRCLSECKLLNSPGLLQNASATADKILYNHAIHMVRYSLFIQSNFMLFFNISLL